MTSFQYANDCIRSSKRSRNATPCHAVARRHGDERAIAAAGGRRPAATGLVVVGDLIGSGASQEQAIVGETRNLAARLQGVAEPNSVVIAESTRKLLGNLFDLEDLGARDLKGIAGPASLGRTTTGFGGRPLRRFPRGAG